MPKQQSKHFVVCVNNQGYSASLETWKIYLSLRDPATDKHSLMRSLKKRRLSLPKRLFADSVASGVQESSLARYQMQENFRQFLDRLRDNRELVDLTQPVDIRHIATLVDQAKTALLFHNVIGYGVPVVSGIIRSRERATMALGCANFAEIEQKLAAAIAKPIPPRARQRFADPRGDAGRRRCRPVQAADPDVVDL